MVTRRALRTVAVAVAVVAVLAGCRPHGPRFGPRPPRLPDAVALPIVFVHGFAGSAQQYESQAQRFAANGYPLERIVAFDHDGAGFDIAGYVAGLDQMVDDTRARFHTAKVYLVGHSRGTFVSSQYLADPSRAAKVAKYVAIDGAGCPAVVPCIAPTQGVLPGQSHVEVATSKESFALQYEFLVERKPVVVDLVPERGWVELSGRAVNFPANTGRSGVTLAIWRVDGETGLRSRHWPDATFRLGADGAFGPFHAVSGAHYEYELSSPDSPVRHHLYLQPAVRDSRLVRLLSSDPGGATRTNTNVGPGHAAIVAIRMREWYAHDDPDLPGDQSDVLTVTSGDRGAVNVLSSFVGNATIGLHLHDGVATPGQSTLGPLPYFSTQPFQSGIDVFLPAAEPATGTLTVRNIPRGDTTRPQTLNVANWPSDSHSISVVFTDYPVDPKPCTHGLRHGWCR